MGVRKGPKCPDVSAPLLLLMFFAIVVLFLAIIVFLLLRLPLFFLNRRLLRNGHSDSPVS